MKQPTETNSDFAFVLGIHCKRWLEAKQAYDNFERMREIIKLEQFYERIHPVPGSWIRIPRHSQRPQNSQMNIMRLGKPT